MEDNVVLEDSVYSVIPSQGMYGIITPQSLFETLSGIPYENRFNFLPEELNIKKGNPDKNKRHTNLKFLINYKVINQLNEHFTITNYPHIKDIILNKQRNRGESKTHFGNLLYELPLYRLIMDKLRDKNQRVIYTHDFSKILSEVFKGRNYDLKYLIKFIGNILDEGNLIDYQYMKGRIILEKQIIRPTLDEFKGFKTITAQPIINDNVSEASRNNFEFQVLNSSNKKILGLSKQELLNIIKNRSLEEKDKIIEMLLS